MNPRAAFTARHPLQRVLLVLVKLQQIHERWEMRSAALFLYIAWKGEAEKPELERLFSMSPASGHRNIELLRDALLIDATKENGVVVVRLAERGRRLAGELKGIVGSGRG